MIPARRLAAGMAAIVLSGMVCAFGEVAAGATTAASAAAPNAGDLLDVLQNRYITLAEKGRAAVVRVNAVVRANSNDAAPTPYVWSGFFIDRNGDILTNNASHLQNAMRVWVDYNGIIYSADVIGFDPVTDIGLLHLPNPPKDFTALDLKEVPAVPPIGTMLLAVTSKLGQPPGPSPGMVEGYNVNVGEVVLPTLHLRVNIPDDGGEGGSPVLDLNGRLVGMMVASLRDSRSSLVLPSSAVLRIRDELLANDHHVHYGLFGFDVNPETSTETAPRLIIKSVDYGGPALAAGLKAGDVLLSVGGVPLRSNDDLRQAWFFSHPGEDLALVVERDHAELQLTLHVGEMTLAAPASSNPVALESTTDVNKAVQGGDGTLPVDPGVIPDTEQVAPPVDKKSK